jgi:AraC-like DNA-binding protein
MAPLRWLAAARIREARRLLEATDLPIEVIAARCGLGTAANLRLHLARDAGTTPTHTGAARRTPVRQDADYIGQSRHWPPGRCFFWAAGFARRYRRSKG